MFASYVVRGPRDEILLGSAGVFRPLYPGILPGYGIPLPHNNGHRGAGRPDGTGEDDRTP